MKAVVLTGPQTLVCQDVPTPAPQTGEVLVRVHACSICGSDLLRIFKGNAKRYPIILGHEVAGKVVGLGTGVEPTWLGRRVAIIPLIPAAGPHSEPPYGFWPVGDYSFIGSRRDGGLADFMTAPAGNLLSMPDAMSMERAALIEPFTVALHALGRGDFQSGMRVVVLGAGSLGLCCLQWARVLGAGYIVATDLIPRNLATAAALGAHATVNATIEPPIERVLALTHGADLVLETTGAPAVLEQAVQMVRPHGIVVCIGNLPRDSVLSGSFVEEMMKREAQLRGNWMSYSSPFPGREWGATCEALNSGVLDVSTMITHRCTLSETPEIIYQMRAGTLEPGKVLAFP